MPTFPHIELFFPSELVPIEEMCLQNSFLIGLNESIGDLIESGVSLKIFASSSESTREKISVFRYRPKDSCDRERWPDGWPVSSRVPLFGPPSSGDSRVLYNKSAYPVDFVPEFSLIPIEQVTGNHAVLPDLEEVSQAVVEFLED